MIILLLSLFISVVIIGLYQYSRVLKIKRLKLDKSKITWATPDDIKIKFNNAMALIIIGGVGLLLVVVLKPNIPNNTFESKYDERVNSVSNTNNNSQEESNTCSICGNKFTGRGYEETSEGVWEPCKEPYRCQICSQNCGWKHTREMNDLIQKTSGSNSSGNSNGKDGKIYDQNLCSLCKGTGIEKNNGSLSDEYGRVCPMCNGKGKQSY